MRKKYVSPLFAELELEDVLVDSPADNVGNGNDEWGPGGKGDDDWDDEEGI